jgi:hypothetical protein
MPETRRRPARDKLKAELERVCRPVVERLPEFQEILRRVLAALDYDDAALVRSALSSILELMKRIVEGAIRDSLKTPGILRDSWQTIWKEKFEGEVFDENLDEIGTELEALFAEPLRELLVLRDESVKLLQDRGYEVENAAQLDSAIAEIQKLKEDVFRHWPWSKRQLPVNRKMAEESLGDIARGERGETKEELFRRLHLDEAENE